MDEAQALADRVAIIAGGRIVADAATTELGGRERSVTLVSFLLPDGMSADELPPLAQAEVSVDGERVQLRTHAPTRVLATLAGWGARRGLELPELEARRPSLEEIYLQLTGAHERHDPRADAAALRPEKLLAQPPVRLLHGDPADHLPVHLRERLR